MKAGYLLGHGEHPRQPGTADGIFAIPGDPHRREEPPGGNAPAWGGDHEIPADCQLLIIAGPTSPFLPGKSPRLTPSSNAGTSPGAAASVFR